MSKVSEKLFKLEEDLFEMEYYGYCWHKDGTEITVSLYAGRDGNLPPRPPFDITEETTFSVAPATDWETIYEEILVRMHKIANEGVSQTHYRKHRFETFNYAIWQGRTV